MSLTAQALDKAQRAGELTGTVAASPGVQAGEQSKR